MQRCQDERIVRIVRKLARMVKLEKITRARYQRQFLEGSVRNGQNKRLILTNGEMKEITTSVEIWTTTMGFGVTPPTKTKDGKTAMCQCAKVKLALLTFLVNDWRRPSNAMIRLRFYKKHWVTPQKEYTIGKCSRSPIISYMSDAVVRVVIILLLQPFHIYVYGIQCDFMPRVC